MALDIAQILGWTATVLFSLMIIPQMVKTVKTKSTKGVSLSLFIIFLVGNIIALGYSYLISQPPLMIKYSIAIVSTIIYISLYFKYSKRAVSNL